jgi:hypothetical protein
VTGIHHVFAGITRGSIHRGVYDPAAPGRLRWEADPELSGTGRVMAFAEANGVLYAAAGLEQATPSSPVEGGLYRRVDGVVPRWERVYQWPYIPPAEGKGDEARLMRGLTAVPDPLGGSHQVLLGTRAFPGVVERIDPVRGHDVFVELDVRALVTAAWGLSSYGGPTLSAYNQLTPAIDPATGERVHLAGLWAENETAADSIRRGSHVLVRHLDARWELVTIPAETSSLPPGGRLRATRAIEVSPFPEERSSVLYLGGYDCAGRESHNTAWIYPGAIDSQRKPAPGETPGDGSPVRRGGT